jgi:hypothetical protein
MSVFNLLQEIRDYELLACRANEQFFINFHGDETWRWRCPASLKWQDDCFVSSTVSGASNFRI